MNNTVQIKKCLFTFHDYGGHNEQELIKEQEENKRPEEPSGMYRFDQKYCYKRENPPAEDECDVWDEAFSILKNISEVLGKNNNITHLGFEDKNQGSKTRTAVSPYDLDDDNKTIKTKNYVGVIRSLTNEHDVTIEIGSRFDKSNSSQLFLSYLLSKAFDGLVLPEYPPDTSHKNMWELLLSFVFASQLKEAYRQGLYKSYYRFEYNDPKVKGKIDVNRHVKNNTPFVGNIAYSVREHTFDTPILHLILHTFERLEKRYPTIMGSLHKNDSTGTTLADIKRVLKEVNGSFNSNDVHRVLLSTNKRINHPYFNKYEPLRKTCRMILKDMGINVFDNDQEQQVYGVLINMNWLWENFVGKEIFTKCGFRHVKGETALLVPFEDNAKEGKGAVKSRKFDFIKEKVMVADAKYKPKWAEEEWDKLSDDIFQVLSYMFVSGAKKGGVAFPQNNASDAVKKYHVWTDHSDNPYSQEYYFYTIPVRIPNTSDAEEFKDEIKKNIRKNIEDIVKELKQISSEVSVNPSA